jgi:hypothetical protein
MAAETKLKGKRQRGRGGKKQARHWWRRGPDDKHHRQHRQHHHHQFIITREIIFSIKHDRTFYTFHLQPPA